MNDSGATELIYEDFVMRLDGPMIEVVGASFKGLFRLHVNFARRNAGGPRRGRPTLGSRRGSAGRASG